MSRCSVPVGVGIVKSFSSQYSGSVQWSGICMGWLFIPGVCVVGQVGFVVVGANPQASCLRAGKGVSVSRLGATGLFPGGVGEWFGLCRRGGCVSGCRSGPGRGCASRAGPGCFGLRIRF